MIPNDDQMLFQIDVGNMFQIQRRVDPSDLGSRSVYTHIGTLFLTNPGEQILPMLNCCWETAGPEKRPRQAGTH